MLFTVVKTIYSWRTLGCAAVVYVIVFTIDVTIGGTFIVWKCHFRYDADECRLAGGGTLGSVLIWYTVLFILPKCVTKIDRDDIRNACRRCVHKVRPPVSREIQREHPV
ncbi:hypothetical protein DPMN_077582 [Dreissena polymorpha]|uniref:Uncharacterized protein n=2 Tax=Dreissena polymorpha TaxID=45954 RepID=A0A9D4BPG8_DREPO|nr:hypothetical protein DPMN_077582 [Dreissena polymorpha]